MDATAVLDLQAQLDAAVGALHDCEARAAAGQLAMELMHELRNPLEALGYLVYLASGEANQPQDVQRYMDLAKEQVTLLTKLVGQTLGFGRSSSSKPIDLVLVADAAVRIHQRKMEAKKVRLIRDLPHQSLASVHMGEMLQVLSNLIGNALDALPETGTLYVRMRKRQDGVHFLIADNGHGVHAEDLEEIFKPFFSTKGEHGIGLGLSLSKNIVERHRGKIRIRSSVRPGKSGTLFKVSLPA